MRRPLLLASLTLLAAILSACAVTLVPGADHVRVTKSAADVQACKAVGNIDAERYDGNKDMMRNAVVGDGGDTLLLTTFDGAVGVAYRCARE